MTNPPIIPATTTDIDTRLNNLPTVEAIDVPKYTEYFIFDEKMCY